MTSNRICSPTASVGFVPGRIRETLPVAPAPPVGTPQATMPALPDAPPVLALTATGAPLANPLKR